MARLCFFVIVISLSTFGFSSGASKLDLCDDELLCVDKPPVYDQYQQHIDEMVNQNKNLISNELFELPKDVKIDITGDDENCMSKTTIEQPFVIKTNVTSEFVVQSSNFKQMIRMTRCLQPQSRCFTKIFGIKTSCEEKFGGVSLYIYDPEINKIRYKMFDIPVCCVCNMKVDYGDK